MQNFQNILAELDLDLKIIDSTILEFAKGKSPLIQEISEHLINSGGKRVRPILLLLAAQTCGEKIGHDLAAAVELIHSATLLHDDVVDTSQIRRGKKTANALWDNKASILVGDYLFSVAFQLMVRGKNLRILDLLAKASSTMADGEVMQLQNSNDVALSLEKYLEIIFGKTAVLFSAACECGALINNRPEPEVAMLRDFGKNLGITFQIVDDVLDYSSQTQVLGKDIGDDFYEGKVTLPIILTYAKADADEQKLIAEIFAKNFGSAEKNQNHFATILSLIKKYDGLGMSRDLASSHCELAIKNLEIFPDSSAKQNLLTVLNHSFSRIS
ncbi:MAG: polyprenyl synthetase family protein [Proteobacteria bacterium]|nr:polyprenyl synthetase family protein [Pseudomonadota bacterium]